MSETDRHDRSVVSQAVDLGPDSGVSRRVTLAFVFGVLAVAHVVATRMSWAGIPFQTDSGMWAYIGARILDGALPYQDLWESKPPGIYYTFAAVEWIFGVGGDRALLWLDAVVSLGVFGVTFAVARRVASRTAAAAAVLLLSVVFCHRALADWGNNVEKFVALFEMLACYLVLRAVDPKHDGDGGRGGRTWLIAGICCGVAGLFKQTGILFLTAATMAVLFMRIDRHLSQGRVRDGILTPTQTQTQNSCGTGGFGIGLRAVGLLVGGAALVWVPVVVWMMSVGNFDAFLQQVVRYDLLRVGSGDLERSRLADPQHWSMVGGTFMMTLVLFGPAAVGACYWVRRRLAVRASDRRGDSSGVDRSLIVVVVYWLLTTAVYPIAPYGYGHYLLQAAPPAAILAAWMFDQTLRERTDRVWATAAMVAAILGLSPLDDHFKFTFDRDYEWRVAYDVRRSGTEAMVEVLRAKTEPRQSVMLWPPEYGVSYYARRRTPLEMSNADVIFKNKINRLSPPMSELLARLKAAPPDVIVDWTPVNVALPPTDDPDGEPHLLTPAGGFSLAEPPNDNHPMLEGRTLAPMKEWLRERYGGQERVGHCTIYYRDRPWRLWQDVLLSDAPRRDTTG